MLGRGLLDSRFTRLTERLAFPYSWLSNFLAKGKH
jgi:hypothetical protein